ncbi:hypothetical protein SAMN05444959_1501, partial [Paracoccus seriniphilus]
MKKFLASVAAAAALTAMPVAAADIIVVAHGQA